MDFDAPSAGAAALSASPAPESGPAPAEAGPPTPTTSPNPANQATQSPAQDWVAALPDDLRGLAEVKGWKDPADGLRSYQQLEQLFGHDKAGRTVLLPKGDDDAEGREALYKALGRPDTAEGYDLTKTMADQPVDPGFMADMGQSMHQMGLSKQQAQGLARAYNEQLGKMYAGLRSQQEADLAAYKAECGAQYEARRECARRAAERFGITPEKLTALEANLGTADMMRTLSAIGQALGEDVPPNQAAPGDASYNFSPAGARTKIDELTADESFRKRYLRGDPEAMAQMERLSKAATSNG